MSCIDGNAMMFYKNNSDKLMDIYQKLESLPCLDGKRSIVNGKRNSTHLNLNTKLAKHLKSNDCEERTESTGMTKDQDKSEDRTVNKRFDQAESSHHVRTTEEEMQLSDTSQQNKRFLSPSKALKCHEMS